MERKIRLSIRVKIIAVIAALVVLSLGLYLVVALSLFNRDKSAYIFESTLTTAETASTQVEVFLNRLVEDSLSIYNLLAESDFRTEPVRTPLRFEEAFAATRPVKLDAAKTARLKRRVEQAGGVAAPLQERVQLARRYLAAARRMRAAELAGVTQATEGGKSAPVRRRGFRAQLRQIVQLFEPQTDADDAPEASPEPKTAGYLYVYGEALAGLGRYTDAELRFKQFVALYSRDARLPEVALALGDLHYLRREADEAETYYHLATKARRRAVAQYATYKLAWTAVGQGRIHDASRLFARLLQDRSVPAPFRAVVLGDATYMFAVALDVSAASTFFQKIPDGERFVRSVKSAAQRVKAQRVKPGEPTPLQGRRLLRSLFYGDPDIVEFSVYQKQAGQRPGRLIRLVNSDYLKESDLEASYLDRVDAERPLPFAQVTAKQPVLQNSSLKSGMGLETIIRQDPNTGRYLVVRFKLDRFLAPFTQNRVYSAFLIGPTGDLLAHQDSVKVLNQLNMLDEPYVRSVIKSGQKSGVREFTDRAGEDIIVGYGDPGVFGLRVFSVIKHSKAFLAARQLTIRSLYFGIFFIAVAMIIGIIFAKTLTNPIDKLFKGTQIIAAGNFKAKVAVEANDEIGVLADSFNFMAGRIVDLLEQEKDKVRLEEELKVAKLVQDSFFPANHLEVGGLDIAAFYTPAAECGGDWWGLVRSGHKTLLMIGDATGHGVPAALITATAASCTTTIQELGAVHPGLLESPARIQSLLNKAVYGATQGKILMTFFVCLVDPDKQTITYSNASHNPPYLYKYKDKDPDKKDLVPLMDAVGMRLGHKVDSTYEDAIAEISANDVLVFFTDGFIECTNPSKEEYGSRKFIKSILKNVKAGTEEILDGIVGSAMDFYGAQPLADDLTMVVAKVQPEAHSTTAAA